MAADLELLLIAGMLQGGALVWEGRPNKVGLGPPHSLVAMAGVALRLSSIRSTRLGARSNKGAVGSGPLVLAGVDFRLDFSLRRPNHRWSAVFAGQMPSGVRSTTSGLGSIINTHPPLRCRFLVHLAPTQPAAIFTGLALPWVAPVHHCVAPSAKPTPPTVRSPHLQASSAISASTTLQLQQEDDDPLRTAAGKSTSSSPVVKSFNDVILDPRCSAFGDGLARSRCSVSTMRAMLPPASGTKVRFSGC